MKKITYLLTGLVLWALAAATAAFAQAYPDKPIHIVVPGAPGASADVIARVLAEKFSKALGQPVIVDDRPGAGGVVAVRALLNSKADGYTLAMLASDGLIIAPFLAKTLPYDPLKDIVYAGQIGRSNSFILAVHPSVPVQNVEEFLRLAKTPKRISYSTYGLGSAPHLGFEMLSSQAGLEMVHAPFKGGAESYQAALAGNVDAVAGTSFFELLKSGRLRPLAIGGSKRSSLFPNIPTFAELGYGDQMFGPVFYSIAAPAGTPKEVIERLTVELKKIVEMPDVAEKLAAVAAEPYFSGPDELMVLITRGVNTYGPLIKKLGLSSQ